MIFDLCLIITNFPVIPSLIFWGFVSFRNDMWSEDCLAQATNTMDYTIQFLVTELESVGNIRLEEGCTSDPW